MLNEKMIMTGSNVVQRGRLKELDREDARKRPGEIVLRMTWKVQICPKRMRSPGINGEELRGNRLTQVHLEKWPLKRCVCVCVCVCGLLLQSI